MAFYDPPGHQAHTCDMSIVIGRTLIHIKHNIMYIYIYAYIRELKGAMC